MLSRFLIPKEEVTSLNFPDKDVLISEDDRTKRQLNLTRALVLGNLDRVKVQIVLRVESGLKVVETTIWGLTDKDIILKRGVIIPIRSVLHIEIL